jgi:hypothetical protein
MSMRVQYLKLCYLIGNIRIDAGMAAIREAMRFSAYLWQPHKNASSRQMLRTQTTQLPCQIHFLLWQK